MGEVGEDVKCCKHCHMLMPPDGKKVYCTMWCKLLAEQDPCPVCGKSFLPSKHDQKYCSVACQHKVLQKEKPVHVCENCGKEFARFPNTKDSCRFCSRDCSFEYRRKHPEIVSSYTGGKINGYKVGAKRNIYYRQCRQCKKTFVSMWETAVICSDNCRAIDGCESARRRSMIAHYKNITPLFCTVCGKRFFRKYGSKNITTCSEPCDKALKRHHRSMARRVREARIRDGFIEIASLEYLFFRDNGRCQICGKKLNLKREVPHKLAATVDHILPLSAGGEHSKKNTQLACFMCNSLKSGGSADGGDQLLLFG
jgi:DNA-directed RNA polymerase subunit RPC12/RpoP